MITVVAGHVEPLGFQQIALTSTAVGLTVPNGARIAVIDCAAQNARWRDDGTAPTATVGMRILADTELTYNGSLGAIKLVAEVAGSIINVSYYC